MLSTSPQNTATPNTLEPAQLILLGRTLITCNTTNAYSHRLDVPAKEIKSILKNKYVETGISFEKTLNDQITTLHDSSRESLGSQRT